MISRRGLIGYGLAGAFGLGAGLPANSAPAPDNGRTLIVAQDPEPLTLTSAASIDAGTLAVSGKIFDRLFALDLDTKLTPQLATSAEFSADGLALTLRLRPGVKWHDGRPFGSADVAYSILEVWKKFHARGFLSYANVEAVDAPDPLTAVLRLKRPAPYILHSLAQGESQVVPRRLYEGAPVLTNPVNLAPIGTGPFRFVRWERGGHIELERNPDYWDSPRPHFDKVLFRFLPDGAAVVAALETKAIHLASGSNTPRADLERLRKNAALSVKVFGPTFSPVMEGFAFNLDRPALQDVRVRQAFAHAIDRNFILKNIWQDVGTLADSPVAPQFVDFYTSDLPKYPFDLARAESLLEEAGLKRDASGVRLTLTVDVMPPGTSRVRTAQFIRGTLAKIGVKLELRSQSLGEYLHRVFTRRDFDAIVYGTGTDIDPALGIQRFYWSKTFQPGVPFTNATHYWTPEVDRLLETAQVELDANKRRQLYFDVQRAVQRDLPCIPILFPSSVALSDRRLIDFATVRADNFAKARFATA